MSTLFKANFAQSAIQSIIDDLFLGKSNFYYAIGRSYDWEDETVPPDSVDTERYEFQSRNDILFYKRIDGTSVSFIIDRIDYLAGEVYDIYDDSISLSEKSFYVMTSNYNVYKCLYNNNGNPSTIEPFGTSNRQITYSDGYVWKFVYTIPPALRNKFLTPSSIPVYNAITEKYYNRGSLNSIIINSAGVGYSQNGTSINVSGDGYIADNPHQILGVTLQKGGSGYTTVPSITPDDIFSGSTPWVSGQSVIVGQIIKVSNDGDMYYEVESGGDLDLIPPSHYYSSAQNGTATLKHIGHTPLFTASIDPDKLGSIFIVEEGFGYNFIPAVSVSIGSGAVMNAIVVNGSLTEINIPNSGDGYSSSSVVSIVEPYQTAQVFSSGLNVETGEYLKLTDGLDTFYFSVTSGGMTGSAPTIRLPSDGIELSGSCVLEVVGKRARGVAVVGTITGISTSSDVRSVSVTNGGTGYNQETSQVTFNGGNPTIQATGTAIISGGVVTGIVITHSGYGYESAPTISISGGTGFSGVVNIQSGYGYRGSVELNIEAPDNINGINAEAKTVTRKTEAILKPIIIDSRIRGIEIVDSGIGYTTANITVTGDGYGASLTPLFASGDLSTIQAQSELFAIEGTISSIVVEEGGDLLTEITATVEGDGFGAVLETVIVNSKLSEIKVIDEGVGYSYANIVLSYNIGAVPPSVRVILSPTKGHGYNPIKEMYTKSLAMYNTFSTEFNNGVLIGNTFRQVMIVKNPIIYESSFLLENKTGSSCFAISSNTNNVPLELNFVLTNRTDGSTYRVVDFNSDQVILSKMTNGSILENDILEFTINTIIYTIVVGSITKPQVDKFTGDLLYIDNLKRFSPSEEQSVSINTTFNLV